MTKYEIVNKYGENWYKKLLLKNKEAKALKRKNDRLFYLIDNYRNYDKTRFGTNENTISIEQLRKMLDNGCNWCGETNWYKLGADRIDNSKPHTLENCVCSCFECNRKREHKELSKPVLQYTKSMEFVAEYPSAREASRKTGINISSICQCCKQKRYKSAGGYIWKLK